MQTPAYVVVSKDLLFDVLTNAAGKEAILDTFPEFDGRFVRYAASFGRLHRLPLLPVSEFRPVIFHISYWTRVPVVRGRRG